MATSWTTSGNDTQNWTTQAGPSSALGGTDAVSAVTQDTFLADNQKIYFGNDLDFSLSYDSSVNQLRVLDSAGTSVLSLNTLEIFTGGGGSASAEEMTGSYFRFTADSTLSSGNIAEFRNNLDSSMFSVRYDGVVQLRNQGSTPAVSADSLYSDGTDLYYGKQ